MLQYIMTNNNSNPNKKRKANDGQATTEGASTNDGSSFLSSWFGFFSRRCDETSPGPSQLDRLENIMIRMEEKLTTVSSLESRCENLEAKCSKLEDIMLEAKCSSEQLGRKCSSLEAKLATTSQSMKDHMDRSLRYHEMRIMNQKWKYSASTYSRDELIDAVYDTVEADYIAENSEMLKESTEAMRRGDFPREKIRWNKREVILCTTDVADYDYFDRSFDNRVHNALYPHWREFAAALKQFKPAFDMLPDDCETNINFGYAQLNRETTELIQEALVNIPFKTLSLEFTYRIHGDMSTIASIMTNNKFLQKLDIYQITDMDRNDVAELCSAIHRHPSIKDVIIMDCFSDGGLGNEMLRTLLRTDELKIEKLKMSMNDISSVETTLLPEFLATNPRLKELDLSINDLDDSDAALIANALRSNTKLRHLTIDGNLDLVAHDGNEALRVAVRNESSLNAVADSNHWCLMDIEVANQSDSREINRARKIYALLSSRNEILSNVQHFGDIDVKLLPNILEALQKYSNTSLDYSNSTQVLESFCNVKALSIVYEVMRRWDKVSPLYKSLGKSVE